MIIIQTPLRISLFGGGTDFYDYYSVNGGCALSTAINKYIYIIIKDRFDDRIRIGYTRTELVDNVGDLQHELIREALKMTGITKGVEIATMGDIPSQGSGLGSSGTVTVGALHAMYTYLGELVTAERLAREATEIEIDILGKPIGLQDQYIVAHGGFRFLEFEPSGEVVVNKVKACNEIASMLSSNLMLVYTGVTRSSASVLTEQKCNINDNKAVLHAMKEIAHIAREEIEQGNLDRIGNLLHESWQLKKRLAGKISNNAIDEMYEAAIRAGALGGKVSGAGGGGFLLLYCPYEKQAGVRKILNGYKELSFQFEQDGSKVILNKRVSPP